MNEALVLMTIDLTSDKAVISILPVDVYICIRGNENRKYVSLCPVLTLVAVDNRETFIPSPLLSISFR